MTIRLDYGYFTILLGVNRVLLYGTYYFLLPFSMTLKGLPLIYMPHLIEGV